MARRDCGFADQDGCCLGCGLNLRLVSVGHEKCPYERTTDNAAGRECGVHFTGHNMLNAAGQVPAATNTAAPTQTPTPWTDAFYFPRGEHGVAENRTFQESVNFARRLEALCRQQQEALAASRFTEYAWESGDMRDAALAAYAQLANEMER